MPATPLTYALWATGPVLQLACAFLLWKRKLLKDFNYFFSFLLFLSARSIVLFAIHATGSAAAYFYAYWVGSAVGDMCIFLVLHEIFCAAFKPFGGLRDMAQVVFRWATIAMVLVAFVVFSSSSALPESQRIIAFITNFQKSIRVMQCGLLLFMLMGAHYLGLSFRNRIFGLSLGFGLSASFELLTWSALQALGFRAGPWFAYWYSSITVMMLSIFLFYLAKPEPERGLVSIPVSSPLLRWNEAALAVASGGSRRSALAFAEPFMPSVERMVEQIMHRDMPNGPGRSN